MRRERGFFGRLGDLLGLSDSPAHPPAPSEGGDLEAPAPVPATSNVPTAPRAGRPPSDPVRFRVDPEALDRFLAGVRDPHPPDWFRLRVAAERLSLLPGFDELIALDANAIEELPHQTDTALRVLKQMSGRAILADEVGLGKTIEAGLIVSELVARGLARRILVLCPAALQDQWREELSEKFFLDFSVIDSAADWGTRPRAIASLAKARHRNHRPKVTAQKWDVVIVDEAHKAKNHTTATFRTIQEIERDFILLLTATPLQNDLREFYNLVTLVRPGQFGTWDEFRRSYVVRGNTREPKNVQAIRDIASEVMVRNRRSNVDLQLPPRRPHRPAFELTEAETEVYRSTRDFLRELYREGMHTDAARRGSRFVLTQMTQRVCSSAPAIAASLERMAENHDVRPEYRERARRLSARALAVRTHAKLRALEAVLRAHPDERVVVFSEHRPTIDLIQRHLSARGRTVFEYHGGVSRERRSRIKRAFRDTPGSVFLSSRSGTEGLNLQFARVLVNYELPWNPLLVEQRIGRVHRIGQHREVFIYNLAAQGTVEERVLEVLQEKIRLFELVVGELDVILGQFDDASELEKRFVTAWLSAPDDQAFERAVVELGAEVERGYEEGKAAEERTSFIAPADNADRLQQEFAALSPPARVRLGWGTRHLLLAPGIEARRVRIGLHIHEIQSALDLATDVEPGGRSDYGSTVWIRSATPRGRAVSLRVAADRLPMAVVELDADEEAPLLPGSTGWSGSGGEESAPDRSAPRGSVGEGSS